MTSVNGNTRKRVDLIQGGHEFLCRLDLAKGAAALEIPGVAGFHANSPSGIRGPGRRRVRFANVDDQLVLWLDGRVVQFDRPTSYDASVVDTSRPTEEDLRPVRIGSHGARGTQARARSPGHLLHRHTQPKRQHRLRLGLQPLPGPLGDFRSNGKPFSFRSRPVGIVCPPAAEEFRLAKDQFFASGTVAIRVRTAGFGRRRGVNLVNIM